MEQQAIPIKVFYSYAHEDEPLQKELEKHLIILQRQGLITTWHRGEIKAGAEWKHEFALHLNSADIFLLLLSPDFMASEFCYGVEMKRALERHMDGDASIIPIILRPVDWKGALPGEWSYSLSELLVLPKNGEPVTSWPRQDGRDKAFLEIALGIRDVITAFKDFKIEREERRKKPRPRRNVTPNPAMQGEILDHAIAELQTNRASIHYERQNYEEALAIYEQALSLNAHDTTALRGKGDALQALQRYQEALVAYEQALRLDPNDSLAKQRKADLEREDNLG